MTLVIQFFVFPDAWWSVHILWAALAAILISRGGGLWSLDAIIGKLRAR
jgi:putative oxidoreductase